jgi:mannose-1-phosphate guanylyltransferase
LRALLLAGGYGTRLRPLTDHTPKCLVPVRGRPLLGYWFDLLFPAGIERALVNTHYLPDAVRAFVAASRWRLQVDLVHEPSLLGTGGTILANRDWLGDAPFLVAHADNLTRFDVGAFLRAHASRPSGTLMTMMTFTADDPRQCGIIEADPAGRVIAFHEKVQSPPGDRANAAVYVFEPALIEMLQSLGKPVIDLSTEVIPGLVGRIATFHNDIYHRDIGTPDSLARAEREFEP